MKTILLTHTDSDGFASWFVLDYFNVHYDRVLICDYNRFDDENEYKTLLEYDSIIMTDYSVSAEIVEKLLSANKKVKIIDHHQNENADLLKQINNENFEFYFDSTKAGCMLAYEYYKPKNCRVKKSFYQFVELANTYDLFKKTDPLWEDALNLNRVFYGCFSWGEEDVIEKTKFIREYWQNKLAKYNEWFWTDFELKKINNAIEKETKQFNESKACLKKYVDDKGNKFGVTVAKSKVSLVALKLLEQNEDIKYIAMINTYSGQWDKISLRSRTEEEFDCNSFEECKGHACASGGEVDPQFASKLYKGMQNLTYKKDVLNG